MKRQRKKTDVQSKTANSPRPPTWSDRNGILHGGWSSEVVIRFEFHQHQLSGLGSVGLEICPFPLTYSSLAYATACIITTVQAVIFNHDFLHSGSVPQWDTAFRGARMIEPPLSSYAEYMVGLGLEVYTYTLQLTAREAAGVK